ncbi:polyadenylate-binding protein [Phaffia rhodozyma]|uniref:Polyadenylate-binding protein n=1 Tax=Phaffia rhodozyma TaxID=264483 RepID=A0A0F7SJR2_PHARH|nr:polyadenylate-binding protein [Phaffia rhodozyma]
MSSPATESPAAEAVAATSPAAAPVALPTATSANTQPAVVAAANAANNAPPSASLYVGELDPSVTEAMLFEIFNMIGPVASIRVCRDAVTRRSLGYAYVNYLNAADGERALDSLNYSLIKGRACRIMWSQRDPVLRKTGQGNIFIKNLDEAIDNKALHDTFAAFGNVLSCKVATDEAGNSRGYGFVHYETAEAANDAIKAVNGMLLNDKKVFVGHHVSKKERQSKLDEQKAQFTNIFEEGKTSKGFGFVNYESHEDARKAVDELNDTEVKGKKIFVARAQKKSEREEELRRSYEASRQEKMAKFAGVNLYIKNIDDEWDDERLRTEFENFGTITSAKVMRDESGRSRGFGFVCFNAPDEATKAVSEMNGRLSSNNKPLYVALAQRRDVRRSQLESQISMRANQRMSMVNQMNPMGGFYAAGMPPPGAYPQQRGPMFQGMPGGVRPRYAPPPGYPQGPYPGGMAPPPPGAIPGGYRGGPNNVRPRAPNGPMPGGPQGSRVPPRPVQNGPRPGGPNAGALSSAGLASASPAEQKQALGEALYPLIAAINEPLAGKITGMLLEMDVYELLHLIETPEALHAKVSEAMAVLDQWANESQAAPAPAAEGEAAAAAPAAAAPAAEAPAAETPSA